MATFKIEIDTSTDPDFQEKFDNWMGFVLHHCELEDLDNKEMDLAAAAWHACLYDCAREFIVWN